MTEEQDADTNPVSFDQALALIQHLLAGVAVGCLCIAALAFIA